MVHEQISGSLSEMLLFCSLNFSVWGKSLDRNVMGHSVVNLVDTERETLPTSLGDIWMAF